jgi:hypothetical protein
MKVAVNLTLKIWAGLKAIDSKSKNIKEPGKIGPIKAYFPIDGEKMISIWLPVDPVDLFSTVGIC